MQKNGIFAENGTGKARIFNFKLRIEIPGIFKLGISLVPRLFRNE
jgi:hypothetical protein